MASLASLVRDNTTLDRDQVSHLNRLMSEWGMLADFCFSDLMLYVPTKDDRWLIVGQVRPATAQTVYHTDWVGTFANVSERSVLASAFTSGEITEGDVEVEGLPDAARMVAVPVRCNGRLIAVLTREWVQRAGRPPGELERTYVAIFDKFAEMIREGSFPYPSRSGDSTAAPRVGDGVMALDAEGRVTYLSPNANSALHRCGIHANALGMTLAELGFHDDMVRKAYEQRVPIVEEFEPSSEVALLCRCLPILKGGDVIGGVLLVRDVTDLRKRDRLLISKDATIREIHHRVKNNLQTVAALLRLQARRVSAPEARAALQESVRRVASIALVHETLAMTSDELVEFDTVLDRVATAAAEVATPEARVSMRRDGSFGMLPAEVATPLVMILNELLLNAVEHGFADGGTGEVVVGVQRERRRLRVTVADTGQGLPSDFHLEARDRLGLQIVRTLATGELRGEITLRARPGGGTEAVLEVPLHRGAGGSVSSG